MLSKNKLKPGLLCGLLAVVSLSACNNQQEQSSPTPSETVGSSSSVDQTAATELPPGHPPVAQTPSQMTIAPVPPDTGTGKVALTWTSPDDWTAEPPSSSMRRAQYRASGPGGDAECVIYYFGPGQGGESMANAQRWADQFTQPDGRPSRELLETQRIQINGIPVLMAEVTGTYAGGMEGQAPENLTGYMLLGAVAKGPDANWFFKFTGPQATIETHRKAFEAMIESLQTGS